MGQGCAIVLPKCFCVARHSFLQYPRIEPLKLWASDLANGASIDAQSVLISRKHHQDSVLARRNAVIACSALKHQMRMMVWA